MSAPEDEDRTKSQPSSGNVKRSVKKKRIALLRSCITNDSFIDTFRLPEALQYQESHNDVTQGRNELESATTPRRADITTLRSSPSKPLFGHSVPTRSNKRERTSTCSKTSAAASASSSAQLRVGHIDGNEGQPEKCVIREDNDENREDDDHEKAAKSKRLAATDDTGEFGPNEKTNSNDESHHDSCNLPTEDTSSEMDSECTDDDEDSENDDSDREWKESDDLPRGMFSILGIDADPSRIATMRPNISQSQMLAQVIALSMRHRLTYEATLDIFRMINTITNNSQLPSTKRNLWAALLRKDDLVMVRHLYCRLCHSRVGEGIVPDKECVCGACAPDKSEKSLSYFIQVSLEQQLKSILSIPGIADSLRYRQTRVKKVPSGIEDIYDGKKYEKECVPGGFLSSEFNYSLTINTDGCKVANSSNASAWPILLTINELPPHARKRHMLLAGVWVDNSHPDLNSLLFPSIKELCDLYHTGVDWKPDGVNVVTSRFVTLICSVDSIARPALLNMTQFNGEYGCTFCYAKGSGDGPTRTYPINNSDKENVDNSVTLRTDTEIREHMLRAHETNEKVFGVKGISALYPLPEFDLACGVIVESMHCLFLGAIKQHTCLLIFGKAIDPWYCGSPKSIAVINSRLKNIRTPSRLSRKPRKVETTKNWKASEWRNWLLYYSTLCLKGIVRECDLEHVTLLSRAAYILSKDCIRTEELQESRLLLRTYVKKFQEIFDESKMTFNIHLLTHLADTVENWGPLWAHSAFPFESFNKRIIDSVTSATARPLQIVTRFLMQRFTEGLIYDEGTSQIIKNRIHSILNSGKKAGRIKILNTEQSIHTEFKGLGSSFHRQPDPWQLRILCDVDYRPHAISIFKRAMIKGVEYSCRENKENTKSCNKFVFVKNIGFREIISIVQFRHNEETVCGLFVACFNDLGSTCGARHIRQIASTSERAFITIDDVEAPALIISKHDGTYGIRLANVYETD